MKFALSIFRAHNKQKRFFSAKQNLNYVGYFFFFSHFHPHNERTNSCRGKNFTIRNTNTRSGLIIQPAECCSCAKGNYKYFVWPKQHKRNKASTGAQSGAFRHETKDGSFLQPIIKIASFSSLQ
jgi:hypothetical protein